MIFLKKLGLFLGYTLALIFILTLIMTLFNYFNLIGPKILSFLKIIIPSVSIFIGGLILGKKCDKKGWLEGIKYSLIFILILVIFNYLIFSNNFEIKHLLFYIILIISTIFGSMVGISMKKSKK